MKKYRYKLRSYTFKLNLIFVLLVLNSCSASKKIATNNSSASMPTPIVSTAPNIASYAHANQKSLVISNGSSVSYGGLNSTIQLTPVLGANSVATSYTVNNVSLLTNLGLTFDSTHGFISSTKTTSLVAGTATVTIAAVNSVGTSVPFVITINIENKYLAPSIERYTDSLGNTGQSFTYTISTPSVILTPNAPISPDSYIISDSDEIALRNLGLQFNSVTGVISFINGDLKISQITINIVGKNEWGESTPLPLTITVNDIAPTSFSYSGLLQYPMGSTAVLLTPKTSSTITSYSISSTDSTTLSNAGLSFNTTTGIISSSTPLTSAGGSFTITVTAKNSAGSTSLPLTITVNNEYTYVVNDGESTISQFKIDPTNGEWTSLSPATVPTGKGPIVVAIAPSGKYAYVLNHGDHTIWGYTVNQTTGALTLLTNTPNLSFSTVVGTGSISLVFNPKNNFAYVLDEINNNIDIYSFDSTNGSLAKVSSVSTGRQPYAIAFAPSGKYVYVTDSDDKITMYSVDSLGALTSFGSKISTGGMPIGITVEPIGHFVYVINQMSSNISMYSLSSNDGILTPITTIENPATGRQPKTINYDPTGKYIYVSALSNNVTISGYSINKTTGILTKINSEDTIDTGGWGATLDLTGKYFYFTDYNNNHIMSALRDLGSGGLGDIHTKNVGNNPFFITVFSPH